MEQTVSPVREPSVQAVRLEDGKSSRFRSLLELARGYTLFLKFCLSSLICAALDQAVFILFYHLLDPGVFGGWTIAVCSVLARIISATTNYCLNRKAVFRSDQGAVSGVKYAALCLIRIALSAALVTLLQFLLPAPSPALWKVPVDFLLFFLNFYVQRRWVF